MRLTQSEFAQHCGVPRQGINGVLKKGFYHIGASGKRERLFLVMEEGKIDPTDPISVIYHVKMAEKNKKKAAKKPNITPKKRGRKPSAPGIDPFGDDDGEDEEDVWKSDPLPERGNDVGFQQTNNSGKVAAGGGGESRRTLEMDKLRETRDNMRLRNQQIRGTLRNAKLYDEIFIQQLGTSIRQFRTVTVFIDPMIAMICNLIESHVERLTPYLREDAAPSDFLGIIANIVTENRARFEALLLDHVEGINENVGAGWTANLRDIEAELLGLVGDTED